MHAEYDGGRHMAYVRDCAYSSDYDDKTDECRRCEGFTDVVDVCVCDKDNCNAGNNVNVGIPVAAVALSSVIMTKLI